ncbi:MAG: ABC transporter permease [Gemmatimonadota bacterium]
MAPIYRLTLRQISSGWRLLIMAVLAALPVIVAALTLRSSGAPSVRGFEDAVLSHMLAGAISPLVVLAIATTAFGHEIEDGTLANLTLAPIPRWKIVLPKLLAPITVAGAFIAVSAYATGHLAYLGDVRATLSVTAGALAGVALYAAAFVWLGLLTSRAVWVGLAYIVLWEELFTGIVSGARLFSVRYHSIALTHGLDERRFPASDHPELGVVIAILAVAFAGFVWLSVRRLRRMDVP